MTAKTDRELLELAAKAAGITLRPVEVKNVEFQGDDRWIGYMTDPSQCIRGWFDPLNDDGDALRLATKLMMEIRVLKRTAHAEALNGPGPCSEESDDIFSAVRRAIVRAAAAIGETL